MLFRSLKLVHVNIVDVYVFDETNSSRDKKNL